MAKFVGTDAVGVTGLRELSRALREVEDGLQRDIGGVFRQAVERIAGLARGKIKSRTGQLASSIRPYGTQREAGIRMGSAKVPYAGPYEFGGYPKGRPFIREGRALYPTFREQADNVGRDVTGGLTDLIQRAGLD